MLSVLQTGLALALTLIASSQAGYLNRSGNRALAIFSAVLTYALAANLTDAYPGVHWLS